MDVVVDGVEVWPFCRCLEEHVDHAGRRVLLLEHRRHVLEELVLGERYGDVVLRVAQGDRDRDRRLVQDVLSLQVESLSCGRVELFTQLSHGDLDEV